MKLLRERFGTEKEPSISSKKSENTTKQKLLVICQLMKNFHLQTGEWLDLCRGPHLPSTGRIGKAFKLTKIAGAYWRGDSVIEQLQQFTVHVGATKKRLQKGYQAEAAQKS